MINGLVGKKLDQTQAFLENGKRIPLSLISVSGNWVTQVKTPEKDKYSAIQMGFGEKKKVNKSVAGHIKKAGKDKTPRFFREVRIDDTAGIEVGQDLKAEEIFEAGDVIDVTGTSKGKGYAGVVKRHNFKGGPRTHGQSDRERAPGSSGQTTTPGRVYKGKRMSGRMGNETVTVKNLTIIDIKDGVMYVKGLVPGIKGALVMISKVKENKGSKALKKKYIPLYKEAVEEVTVEEEVAGPVIETVEVEALPEEPEVAVEAQVEEAPAEKTEEVAAATEEKLEEAEKTEEKVEEKTEDKKE